MGLEQKNNSAHGQQSQSPMPNKHLLATLETQPTVSTCFQSSTTSCLLSNRASGKVGSPSRELPAVK